LSHLAKYLHFFIGRTQNIKPSWFSRVVAADKWMFDLLFCIMRKLIRKFIMDGIRFDEIGWSLPMISVFGISVYYARGIGRQYKNGLVLIFAHAIDKLSSYWAKPGEEFLKSLPT
jgi:hypothetical protein